MKLSKQFQTFLIVGVSNTLVCYLVYDIAYQLLGNMFMRAAVAQTFGYVISSLWSYELNKRWTFRTTNRQKNTPLLFFGTQAVMYVINTTMLSVFVDYLGWSYRLSWFCVTAAVTLLNFSVLKGWVFRERTGS